MSPVMTFLQDSSPQNADANLLVAAGPCPLGGHQTFSQAEINQLTSDGVVLQAGPASSPGAPPAGMAVVAGAAGLPNGAYKYVITFVTDAGETLASPEVSVTLTSAQGSISAIPVGPANSGVTKRKIYRTAAAGASGSEKLVTTINDNTTTTFTDNLADGSLGAVLPVADTSSNAVAVATALKAFEWHTG